MAAADPLTDDAGEQARVDLWRFAAACFYEPTAEFTEERLFDSLQTAASHLDGELAAAAARMGAAFAADDIQTLLVDYARLFLGPMHPLARPYASSWLSDEPIPNQDFALDLLGVYAQGGFELDDSFKDQPDHIAVELEFLYQLAFRQRQLATSDNADEMQRLTALRQRFLADHLAAWAGQFSAALRVGADTNFYRELGAFTARLVEVTSAR